MRKESMWDIARYCLIGKKKIYFPIGITTIDNSTTKKIGDKDRTKRTKQNTKGTTNRSFAIQRFAARELKGQAPPAASSHLHLSATLSISYSSLVSLPFDFLIGLVTGIFFHTLFSDSLVHRLVFFFFFS